MEVQGKHVILFIFATALAAAVFAWTFQYQRGRRILQLWGAENARLIRVEAERINLIVLEPAGAAGEESGGRTIEIDGAPHAVLQRRDIADARGIIHARQALIEDASFDWEKQRGDCKANWQYAIQFQQADRQATVLLDTHCQRARLLETGREAAIAEKIFKGWMTFIDEQLASSGQREASAS